MTDEMPVPTHSTNQVDPLAERYRAAFDKITRAQTLSQTARTLSQTARAEWIEATIELGEVILEARRAYPDTRVYGDWLVRNNLRILTPSEITAHAGLARDPEAGRKMMQASKSYAVRTIWESVAKREQRTLPETGKGAPRPHSRKSGSRDRRRAQRIPDVMQDQPPRPRPLEVVRIKGLTREEVDPDFKGDAIAFAAKYGHVNLHTKAEIEDDKLEAEVAKWAASVANAVRAVDAILPLPQALSKWLAKPGKAARLQAWQASLTRGRQRLGPIPPEPKEQIAPSSDLLTDECPGRHSLND